jgi:hypothetical protein
LICLIVPNITAFGDESPEHPIPKCVATVANAVGAVATPKAVTPSYEPEYEEASIESANL